MQRYEFSDGKANKFWQIEQQVSELHIAWGKVGTAGQSQVKAFDSEAKAQAAKDKLVKEKTGKGYVAVGDAPEVPSIGAEAAASAKAQADQADGPAQVAAATSVGHV